MSAEQAARKTIDELLRKAGWHVCDVSYADLRASRGVAIREFPLAAPAQPNPAPGRADAGCADCRQGCRPTKDRSQRSRILVHQGCER